MNFESKKALVTGAAGGIGAAIVRLLREAGAAVAVARYDDLGSQVFAVECGFQFISFVLRVQFVSRT